MAAKCAKSVNEDLSGVTFTFANGSVLNAVLDNIPEETRLKLMLHGLSQKVGDSYAGAESVEDAEKSATEMYTRLTQGEWGTVRSAGASKRASMLAEALAEALSMSLEEAINVLESVDKETKANIQKHPDVAPVLERMKIERAQAKLAELEKAKAENPSDSLASLLAPTE